MLVPDPDFAALMVRDVNGRLVSSFEYIMADVIGESGDVRNVSTSPMAHSLQNLLREAAVVEDIPRIERLFAEHRRVLERREFAQQCHVIPWGSQALTPSEFNLLQSAFQDDIGLTARLVPPGPELILQFRQTMALLKQTLPQHLPLWWKEIEALVSIILLAEGEGAASRFGGATAFAAWGAILINPVNTTGPLPLALALVHESSHQKLFYAYLDDEIVLNAPEELYSSPLRREGRPMNGIFHAAFVLARMIQFLNDLTRSGVSLGKFSPFAKAVVQQEMGRYKKAFKAAHMVVETHGVLTPKGAAIMKEAVEAVTNCNRTEQTV